MARRKTEFIGRIDNALEAGDGIGWAIAFDLVLQKEIKRPL
jgi:hypothetical protein